MVADDLERENERLRKELDELRKSKSALKLKVSQKGAVSLYGLQKFPITLYANQWGRIFELEEEIKAFIIKNHKELSNKR